MQFLSIAASYSFILSEDRIKEGLLQLLHGCFHAVEANHSAVGQHRQRHPQGGDQKRQRNRRKGRYHRAEEASKDCEAAEQDRQTTTPSR